MQLIRVKRFLIPFVDGLSTIYRTDGIPGLFRGTALALVGVSNGAIQFVVYEKMKHWGFERRRKRHEKLGLLWNPEVEKLVRVYSFLF